MAFMQGMQAGHTSLESALERIRLLRAQSTSPILGPALADAIDETRRFRHVARKTYDDFAVERAAPAVAAARLVHHEIAAAIAAFRNAIEP